MDRPLLTPTLTVAEVLRRWPQTTRVFLEYQMACVGCPMALFDTLADVAAIYNIAVDHLLDVLYQAIHTTEADA